MAIQEPDNIMQRSQVVWLQQSGLVATIALCIALLGIASGSILFVIAGQEMSPYGIAFNRLLIAAIVFAIWNALQSLGKVQPQVQTEVEHAPSTTPLRDGGILLIAGASFVLFLVLLAWALTQTSVANAALFTHMMPIFTTLGAWLIFGRRFSPRFLVGMVVAMLGAIAIGVEDLHLADGSWMGDAAALLAAVLFATEILMVEQLRTRFPTPIITMGECAIGSILVLPVVLLSGEAIFPPTWQSTIAVLGLAFMTQIIGHGLLTYSLKHFSASLVAVAMLAVPGIAAGFAMVLFGQTISILNGFAFLVVLLGIYLSVSATSVED
ncbi:DMT family transporter (plasmid) [Kovacikia minuta CCNUW1]|uniref:DMT family transporter n=1 Tax=Kovacikia minuta TaxID=2931930 RepID=UPI001CCFDE7B|nr:DMT family transporter [Kovacikia minuta]UBF30050.1 DMT family transporter [Kovacikia minuta CCNUW1]